jgi:hypothetical protein
MLLNRLRAMAGVMLVVALLGAGAAGLTHWAPRTTPSGSARKQKEARPGKGTTLVFARRAVAPPARPADTREETTAARTWDQQVWEMIEKYRALPDSDKVGIEGDRTRERLMMMQRTSQITLSAEARDAIPRFMAEHELRQLVDQVRTTNKDHWAADPEWLRGILPLLREPARKEAGKAARYQVRFSGPVGAKLRLLGARDDRPLTVPGRITFDRPGKYRLKLTDLPSRPGLVLYPTIELFPATALTAEYLAHAAIPVTFTNEDLDAIAADRLVTRLVALPEETDEAVTSSQADARAVALAKKKGTLLLIVRLGSIDLEPGRPGR